MWASSPTFASSCVLLNVPFISHASLGKLSSSLAYRFFVGAAWAVEMFRQPLTLH